MSELDLEKLFPGAHKGRRPRRNKRTWDVRMTSIHSGKNGRVIRFGLINYAASVVMGSSFIEPSDIEYVKDRIYFRLHDQKTHGKMYKIFSNRNSQNGFYFTMTPSEKAERIYRMNWVNRSYMLKHDDENNLFYIENTKED